ncbi:MAG: hypothetical protein IV105_22975 [Rhizobacter sp.]|nr:hypothetical protein [Rhizobacter sp.]
MNLFEPLQPPGRLPVGAGQALEPGYMLEEFEITKVLGLTSFGVLYLATHVTDQSTVAIKEYLPSSLTMRNAEGQLQLTDPSHDEPFQRGLQSFITEALTLSQFEHPNLLRVKCVWEANGTAYRVMPLLTGTTLLAQRAGQDEPASQDQLQALFDGLLGALEVLHDAELAHGQIEPVNIFMLNGEHPVLMDFDAVHHAVLSDLQRPHLDAYANPQTLPQMMRGDLHALASVLHFAISNHWAVNARAEPLADVLARLKDSASALGYAPEFLSAIDQALALPADHRPGSVAEFRALFAPESQAATSVKLLKPPRRPKRPLPERPKNVYPLNSSESVLALLANFGRGPVNAPEDIEPFENPPVPTLTEEAEPSLPPLRASLFDAMDAGEPLPQNPVGYGRMPYRPMPPIPVNRWRRLIPAMGFGGLVLVCVLALGWVLTA